jgi:PBP1b-binding outer membrane lipoprotein LpoB
MQDHQNIKPLFQFLISFALCLGLAACGENIKNAGGVPAMEVDPTVKGPVSGVGIEAYDIISMTDKMLRDILATPQIAARQTPPRVIVDGSDFTNEGSQPLNKNLIINRLRVDLNRSAKGKIKFIGREYDAALQHERALKREGETDIGTTGLTKAPSGADFKLVGSIGTLDTSAVRSSGMRQRYTQVTFEMLDLESGEIIWSNNYEIEKAAADDAVYR